MNVCLNRESGVEWSAISRPLPGQAVSGDQFVVARTQEGVLLAVIDGLGHGDEATVAARRAVDVLSARADEPLAVLMQSCHQALRDTRGAAMTLVAVNSRQATAITLGVGNVEAVFARAHPSAQPPRETVLLRGGVVGYTLPTLQTGTVSFLPGDVVVIATDGIREDFGDNVTASEPLPDLVERILAQKFRGTDDALILACRILKDDET